MAWRIHRAVVRGEIDNRERGSVRGRLWLEGRAEPVILELEGNGYSDVAGCLVRFENPHPETEDLAALAVTQRGYVGDITASRKVRIIDPAEYKLMRSKAVDHSPRFGNALSIEWFSENNGRVVIETTDFRVMISAPEWRLSPEDEARQREANQVAIERWMESLGEMPMNGEEAEISEPQNEFEWELFLRESDQRAERYGKLLEEIGDRPDADELLGYLHQAIGAAETIVAKKHSLSAEIGPFRSEMLEIREEILRLMSEFRR